MKDRQFGVEIECGFKIPEGDRRDEYDAARQLLIGDRRDEYDAARQLLIDAGQSGQISPHWGRNAGMDGTLLEAKSPVLSGRAGFAEVRKVMVLLAANGGYVTARDGLHIHHDAPEFVDDVEATLRLVQSWVANQALIHRFVAPRRRTSGACPKWNPVGSQYSDLGLDSLQQYKKDREENKGRDFKEGYWGRRDLNIASLSEHGTIEIRLHEGTLDPVRAEAWIRFGQAFLNKIIGIKKPMTSAESRDELLKRIRAPKFAQENLKLHR